MSTLYRVHRLVDRLSALPPMKSALGSRYEREFASNKQANLFRGVFDSYEAAQASAPATRPLGYDHTDAASMYVGRTKRVYPADYPILFWLEKILAAGEHRIFDLGGHIGVSYYAYRKYLDYPAELRWTVHDVPAVMKQGRELTASLDPQRQLDFADRFEDAGEAQVLLASGSLQYLPDTLAERLQKSNAYPHHLLLNLMPMHASQSYFTLQSIGTAFCPYRIFRTDEFIASFEALGYQLVDQWENPEKRCTIPFHPDQSLNRYYGFYFKRG